jgi:GNAT superfamily N-acetyltransferase
MKKKFNAPELIGGRGYQREDRWFDHQIEMTHSFVKMVDVPIIPAGYELRQYDSGDESKYLELFGLAFENENALVNTLDRHLSGGFFVVEHIASGDLVASTVAQEPPERFTTGGELGWVVTDPKHTGNGLGTLVVAAVTKRLRDEGYDHGYLSTDDFRFPAISIYFKLGWEPRLHTEGLKDRWRFIYRKLGLDCDF